MPDDQDLIFPISPASVYAIITRASDTAGLTLKPHDLRRTYAKLSRDGGASLEQVSATLGHSQLSTTQRYLGTNLELALGRACGDHIQYSDDDD